MSRNKMTIKIVVNGFNKLGTREKGEKIIELLDKYNLGPWKYDTGERTKYTYQREEFLEFWTGMEKKHGVGMPFIKGKNFYFDIAWGSAIPYTSFAVIKLNLFESIDSLIEFAKAFFIWKEACYGYVCLGNELGKMYTPGLSMLDCLPGITWINIFGKPYVEMFKEENLLISPAYKSYKLEDGSYIIITSQAPFEDDCIMEEKNENLKKYLGVQHFCSRKYISANTIDEIIERCICIRPDEGYTIPDFTKYYPHVVYNGYCFIKA